LQDINTVSPRYEFTNLQYGRHRRKTAIQSKHTELRFDKSHLEHNFLLLLDTVKNISNKLFVNWVNILPVDGTPETYKKKKLYTETDKALREGNLPIWEPLYNINPAEVAGNLPGRNYSGVPIDDIYNVLSCYLYHNIYTHKWMLYETIDREKRIIPYVILLNKILGFDSYKQEGWWSSLGSDKKLAFTRKWKEFVGLTLEGDRGFQEKLLTSLCLFFDRNYEKKKHAIKNGYKQLKHQDGKLIIGRVSFDEDELDDALLLDDRMTVEYEHLKENIKSLPPGDLYDFLHGEFELLAGSWYGGFFFSDGRMHDEIGYLAGLERVESNNEQRITPKNIYNFVKSLISDTYSAGDKPKYQPLGRFWKTLLRRDKELIRDRLNTSNLAFGSTDNWFNISKYHTNIFARAHPRISSEEFHKNLFNGIRGNLANIVFDVMIKKGVLSEFIPHLKLSEEVKPTAKTYEGIRKNIDPDKYRNAYYFLTGTRYTDIRISAEGVGKKARLVNYFEYQRDIESFNWYAAYALDWVSQLAFFHRYLNTRVMYVTGSTGVGKSTEIPKLLLYALRVIDYKEKGNVICTQPRIPPTKTVPRYVSRAMGVPIEEYSEVSKKIIEGDNYYLQYQYSSRAHTRSTNHLYLKMVTDGLLNAELSGNILMKRLINDRYTLDNQHDIIIVDEAHEHNTNMDLILTMMRTALYHNNSLHLVIISATMDDDEPVYRRYYRDINDNRLYPFNYSLIDETVDEMVIDRINIDRRLHISQPGFTTKHKIIDHVEIKKPFDIIMRLAKYEKNGDILAFQEGTREISLLVDALNEKLPSDMIALPYHGKMTDEQKGYIENIHDKIKDIIHHKSVDFTSIYDFSNIPKTVPRGTYRRAVIVATNVAEASITIQTLKYVIDNGIQKVARFKYQLRNSVMEKIMISESSRLQRRGRVGRVAPGEVFYTYPIDDRVGGIVYSISTMDISENLYQLLREDKNDRFIFSPENDPNRISTLEYRRLRELFEDCWIMVQEQYFHRGKQFTYQGVIGNPETTYDYTSNRPHYVYKTGFSYRQLNDELCDFYIVHPDEMYIRRNIAGEPVGFEEKQNDIYEAGGRFISNKIRSFWQGLCEFILIIDDGDDLRKTEFGKNLMKLKNILVPEMDESGVLGLKEIIIYLYARRLGVADEILKLLPMLKTVSKMNMAIKSEIVNGRYITHFAKARGMYGDNDVIALYKMADNMLRNARKQGILITNKRGALEPVVSEIKKKYVGMKRGGKSGLTDELYNSFNSLYNDKVINLDEDLSSTEMKGIIEKKFLTTLTGDILDNNKEKIRRIADINLLNGDTMISYLKNYSRLVNNFYKYENGYVDPEEMVDMTWFDEVLAPFEKHFTGDKRNPIIQSLLYGYGYNIVRRIGSVDYFILLQYPKLDYIMQVAKIGKTVTNSLVKTPSNYMMFISADDSISILSQIDITRFSFPHIYNPVFFENYASMITDDRMYIRELMKLTGKNALANNIYTSYRTSVKSILADKNHLYDASIWDKFRKVDESPEFQEYIKRRRIALKNQKGGGIQYKPRHPVSGFIEYLIESVMRKN